MAIRQYPGVRLGPLGRRMVAFLEHYPRADELRITSGMDGDHGRQSHHYGLQYDGSPTAAIDIGAERDPVKMRDFAKWLYDNYWQHSVELIHSTPYATDRGFYVKNQRRYPGGGPYGAPDQIGHYDHIHWATSRDLLTQLEAEVPVPHRSVSDDLAPVWGWDASDFDFDRGPMNMVEAQRDGISFFVYKATEGSHWRSKHYRESLERARDAGIPVLGSYHFLWPGDVEAQIDVWMKTVDKRTPWWKDVPWIWQVDAEQSPKAPRPPNPDEIRHAVEAVRDRLAADGNNGYVIGYTPFWLYGDAATGDYDIWASNYTGSGLARPFKEQYQGVGDQQAGWNVMAGRKPRILQFASDGVVGNQQTCCVDKFDGRLHELIRLCGRDPQRSVEAPAVDVVASNGHVADHALRAPVAPAEAAVLPVARGVVRRDVTGLGITSSVAMEGADLGIMRWDPDRNAIAAMFGDNFEFRFFHGEWQSPSIVMYDNNYNVLGIPETNNRIVLGRRRQLWPYQHNNPEYSTILPCDFIKMNGVWYVAAMVTQGLGNEKWTVFWQSRDLVNWQKTNPYLSLSHRDHNGHFVGHPGNTMLTFDQIGDYVYIFGTGGLARDRGIWMWRNKAGEFPHGWWEPWGWDGNRWGWGIPNEHSPILEGRYGELSFRYIDGNCVLSFFDAAGYRQQVRTVKAPDHDWRNGANIVDYAFGADIPQLYGGYISPLSRLDTPGGMHFFVSQWITATSDPYRVMLVEDTLSARRDFAEMAILAPAALPAAAPAEYPDYPAGDADWTAAIPTPPPGSGAEKVPSVQGSRARGPAKHAGRKKTRAKHGRRYTDALANGSRP